MAEDLTFDEDKIVTIATQMSPKGRLAFALICAERMLPNYREFARETGRGGEDVIRRALDYGWDCLLDLAQPNISASEELAKELDFWAPEPGNFSTPLVSAALDAVCSAEYVVEIAYSQDVDAVRSVASLARDTVDMFVQELESMPHRSPSLEEMIRLHPLMQAELVEQQRTLALIISAQDSPEVYAGLRRKHSSLAVGSLQLPN